MKDLEVWAIRWKDHHSVDDWTNVEDLECQYSTIYSVGIKMKETAEVIVLSLNYDPGLHETSDESASCTMNILKKCITRSVRLCRLKDLKDMRQRRLK